MDSETAGRSPRRKPQACQIGKPHSTCSKQHCQDRSIFRYNPMVLEIAFMSDASQPRFGFVNFAETWNGRLAMMGFVIGLATELLTGQGILAQVGLG